MILKFATFVALIMFLNQATSQSVSIKLYYESLCPYSRRIITDHLYQTFNSDLGKYMDVEFLPINNGQEVFFTNLNHCFDSFGLLFYEIIVYTRWNRRLEF